MKDAAPKPCILQVHNCVISVLFNFAMLALWTKWFKVYPRTSAFWSISPAHTCWSEVWKFQIGESRVKTNVSGFTQATFTSCICCQSCMQVAAWWFLKIFRQHLWVKSPSERHPHFVDWRLIFGVLVAVLACSVFGSQFDFLFPAFFW